MTASGFHDLVGLSVERMEDGSARVTLDATEEHLNAGGSVHGGALATLVDTAMGAAVAAGPAEGAPVTIELKVSYLEPGRQGTLEAVAQVRKRGKRVTIVEAEVTQREDGEVVALATATFTTV